MNSKNLALYTTAFTTGLSIMIVEITTSRVLAPYVGTSFVVWTNIIGVILASLSLGYYLGGKLSRKPKVYTLPFLLYFSSIWLFITSILFPNILGTLTTFDIDIRLNSFLASAFLFSAPSIALGSIAPYLARTAVKTIEDSGRIVGNLYATSTIGSIAGTFFTGFYLIEAFDVNHIFILVAIILALNAFALSFKNRFFALLFFSTLSSFFLLKNNTTLIETKYNTVEIKDYQSNNLRVMKINGITQAGMYINKKDFAYPYLKYYDLFKYFIPKAKKVLVIGGAAYTYPTHLMENGEYIVDVVEIDPKLTQLARKYFGLKENPRMNIYHEDGRVFLNKNSSKYDSILVDAFSSYNIPYNLVTIEAAATMKKSLNSNGMVVINIIAARRGEKAKAIEAIYKTFKKVFPDTTVLLVDPKMSDYQIQNLILISFKNPPNLPQNKNYTYEEMLKNIWKETNENNTSILTDNYSPIDQYMLPVYKDLKHLY